MMKKLAILIAPLVLGVCAASAQVNTVEHTVTFAFKFTHDTSEFLELQGKFVVGTNKSVTLKNADFINLYNEENKGSQGFVAFPLNAKIISKNTYNTNGSSAGPAVFVIRDKDGREADISTAITITQNGATSKVKYLEETGVGSHAYLQSENFVYLSKPASPLGELRGFSLTTNNFKTQYIKKTTHLVTLTNRTMKMTGAALFKDVSPQAGVIQGTFKISGAKIIPAPAPPAPAAN